MAVAALVFNGPINHPATSRLRNGICQLVNERVLNAQGVPTGRKFDKVHLLLNSTGGSLDDGFALYSLLRTLPCFGIEVTIVNMGLIASIANVVFLGADKREAVPNALFHFHNFEWNIGQAQTMTRDKFEDMTNILDMSRSQKLALLKGHTTLTDKDFKSLKLLDSPIVRDAHFAQSKGIIQGIGFPQLPADAMIYNVDY